METAHAPLLARIRYAAHGARGAARVRGRLVHIEGAGDNVRRENKAQTIEVMKAFLSSTERERTWKAATAEKVATELIHGRTARNRARRLMGARSREGDAMNVPLRRTSRKHVRGPGVGWIDPTLELSGDSQVVQVVARADALRGPSRKHRA